MKKTRFLALTLVVAIMLMGAGYAYWSDTLTINNTINTGDMEVVFTDVDLTSEDEYIKNISCDITGEGKGLTFEATNLYPGATLSYSATVENKGSIPAVLHEVIVDYADDAPGSLTLLDPKDREHFKVSGTVKVNDNQILEIKEEDNVTLANLNAIRRFLPQKMEPNDIVVIDYNMTLDDTLTGDDLENVYLEYVMTFNFTQHNDPIVNPNN